MLNAFSCGKALSAKKPCASEFRKGKPHPKDLSTLNRRCSLLCTSTLSHLEVPIAYSILRRYLCLFELRLKRVSLGHRTALQCEPRRCLSGNEQSMQRRRGRVLTTARKVSKLKQCPEDERAHSAPWQQTKDQARDHCHPRMVLLAPQMRDVIRHLLNHRLA